MVLQNDRQNYSISGARGASNGGGGDGGSERLNNNVSGCGGGGGGRPSKKAKQSKVPQRGMGVAQLEKLLNEQGGDMGGTGLTVPLLVSTATTTATRPSPRTNMARSAPNTPNSSVNIFGVFGPNPGLSGNAQALHGHPLGVAASVRSDMVGNSNRWNPSPPQPQQLSQQQYPPRNAVGLISSSGVSLRMEPPSNQIGISRNMNLPPSLEGEKMGGGRHIWPSMPVPDYSAGTWPLIPDFSPSVKIPPIFPSPNGLPQLCDNDAATFNHRITNLRQTNSVGNKNVRENGSYLDGDFLSLGSQTPPVPVVPPNFRINPPINGLHANHETTEFNFPRQVNSSRHETVRSPVFYEFFSGAASSEDKAPSSQQEEAANGLDLELRL